MPTHARAPFFLAVGDLHAGRIPLDRLDAAFSAAAKYPDALFLASPGDITDAGLPAQYDILQPRIAALPFPFLATMGNHDAMTGPDAEAQARFTGRMGLEAISYRRQFAGAPFLFLSTDGDINGCEIRIERSLPLLKCALEDGDGPLFVFCHAPLTDTVACSPGRSCFLSTDPGFGLPQSAEVRGMVEAAGRPVVWISGHVHAPLDADGLFHTERLGNAALHSVSLSCPYFTGRDFHQDEPVALFRFEVLPDGVAIRIEDAERGTTLREEHLGGMTLDGGPVQLPTPNL